MINFKGNKGSAAGTVVLFAAVLVFVVLPVMSVILEKNIMLAKGQIIKDAVDITNIASYTALKSTISEKVIDINNTKLYSVYTSMLAKNLNLNEDLTPKPNSVAEGPVTINSLIVYTSGFPVVCPEGNTLVRPSVHAVITVPVKPSLYREVILSLLGRQYIYLKIHVDSDLPVNN
ncbi:MAG: hypothetical protein QXW71_02900 [Thermoplasmata archaeon]